MDLLKIGVILALYGVLFFAFGSLLTCRFSKDRFSAGLTILLGFFLYYLLFQIVALPMMFAGRSLTELRIVWCIAALLVTAVSVLTSRKTWLDSWGGRKRDEGAGLTRKDKGWRLFWRSVPFLVAAVNVILVSLIYSSYWDATYYVGTVSYSVYYDTINTFDPMSGLRLTEFDIRHCLATYHMNDAVICQLFGIHPLIQCKTVMVIVVTVILNLLYYRFACLLFGENGRARALFMGFCFLINLCTYSAYTASSFVLLRTYEGKAITGAVAAMFLLYWFLRLFQEDRREYWISLFVTAWGAVAISTTAMFIVLSGVGCFGLVQLLLKRKGTSFAKALVCMFPASVILMLYLLNRIGLFSVPIIG